MFLKEVLGVTVNNDLVLSLTENGVMFPTTVFEACSQLTCQPLSCQQCQSATSMRALHCSDRPLE